MRQIFIDKGTLCVKEVAQPLLDEHGVLVMVHYSFISSGTEKATLEQAQASLFSNVPSKVKKVLQAVRQHGLGATAALVKGKLKGDVQSLGYSCSGVVVAVGSKVRHINIGDFVACAGAGFAHHADFVCVPELLVARISDERFLKEGSITTIGAIALQGIRQANLMLGSTVCVVGLGLLGQLTVQLAKKSGCVVIGIDLLEERMQLARQLGADAVYHASLDTLESSIQFLTGHHGVDATIITASSASNDLINNALRITRKRGCVVIVGDVGLQMQRDAWYKKEIEVRIACSYGPGRYDNEYENQGHDYPYAYVRWTQQRNMQEFVRLIETNGLTVTPLINTEADLSTIHQAYESIKAQTALGIVLNYQRGRLSSHSTTSYIPALPVNHPGIKARAANTPIVRVGCVGVGGFAKIKLLPIISKLPDVVINGVADVDNANALSVARTYGAARVCTIDDELCMANDIDVLVIASPHKYHCDQAVKAIQAGKAVFLEKPMVTTFEQLAKFRHLLSVSTNPALCVDYNRSFSPFIQKIKRAVTGRTTPLMIQYRMNAGYIPKDHWIQTELGAGRIIGEACHIIELFCSLTDSKPFSVSVEALHASRDDLFPTDNFSVQIRFVDGSLCALMYTALGNSQVSKERMEVHFSGKTIVMDDYMKLEGYGLPAAFDEATPFQDKGHEQLMQRFFEYIRCPDIGLPIPLQRLDMVAHLTLIVDKLACAGGGTQEWAL